jgi:hypothetical protein
MATAVRTRRLDDPPPVLIARSLQPHHAVLLALLAWLPGCLPVTEFSEARKAEQSGDYHRAYDIYCQAAADSPDNRLLTLAIERIAPRAASYWEDRAHQAVDRGDYAEAWRLFMRVLEIRPDHPSAPHLIRRLERDHPETVGPLRQAWLKRGSTVLLASGAKQAMPPRIQSTHPPAEGPVEGPSVDSDLPPRNHQVIAAIPAAPPPAAEPVNVGAAQKPSKDDMVPRTASAARSAAPKSQEQPSGMASPAIRSEGTDEDKTPKPATATQTTGREIAERPSVPGPPGTDTTQSTNATIRNPAPPIFGPSEDRHPFRTVMPPAPRTFTPTRSPQRSSEYDGGSGTRKAPDEEARQPRPVDGAGTPFQFLVVRTLSKKERYFPKTVEVLDGLIIELRGTDDDPKCSLKVYLGNKEVAKLKGVRIGQAYPVVGRSGRVYEIVVLEIIDKRETIRLGIRPTRLRSITIRR